MKKSLLSRWFASRPSAGAGSAGVAAPSGPALRPQALPAGTRLGALRIEQALASGASATLYRATDTAGGGEVAVKVLCAAADDAQARQRFLQEGEHASRLAHPHIVRIHGGGQASGIAFLSMELLPGLELGHWLAPDQLLQAPLVLEIAAQLAEALAHAHRQGVVHRDVKPANVIFDPATRRAVLTDFGLSRAPDAQATRSGLMLGSPAYMAPELLAGAPADARSDLYALGVLTYELLAGRPPFKAASLGALLRAVATEAPPALAGLRPSLGASAPALDALLAPLLAKAADERAHDGQRWAAQARALGRALPPEV
jgi:eukaryotic-like serine/threonine-protein kinase